MSTNFKNRILRVSDVADMLGIHPTTIRNWIRRDRLPLRRQFGPGVVGWLYADIDLWLTQRPIAGKKNVDWLHAKADQN
jgi:predicted DNA-binding transcriptional regulator AlpA